MAYIHIPGSASSNFSFKRGNAGLNASGNCQDNIVFIKWLTHSNVIL